MFVYQFKLCVPFPIVATKLSLGQKLPAWIVFIFYWVLERQLISKHLMITKATFNEKDQRDSASPVSFRHQDEEAQRAPGWESSWFRGMFSGSSSWVVCRDGQQYLQSSDTGQEHPGSVELRTFVFPLLCTELSALPLCCVASDLREPVDSAWLGISKMEFFSALSLNSRSCFRVALPWDDSDGALAQPSRACLHSSSEWRC